MVFASPLPSGDFGVYLTLWLMAGRVNAEKALPPVRALATRIVRHLGGRDGTPQAHAIRDYLEDHTQFLRDPDGAELLHGPLWQARQLLTGNRLHLDCDDIAMLGAALGKAIGLKARFVVVGFGSSHAPYRHVWTELRSPTPGSSWVDLDTTRPQQGLADLSIARRLYREV